MTHLYPDHDEYAGDEYEQRDRDYEVPLPVTHRRLPPIENKVAYVRAAPRPDGKHLCHWPGCTVPVHPRFFSCRPHWFTWPDHIRSEIWREYQPGQERTKTPSPGYLAAANAAVAWAEAYERARAQPDPNQGRLDL